MKAARQPGQIRAQVFAVQARAPQAARLRAFAPASHRQRRRVACLAQAVTADLFLIALLSLVPLLALGQAQGSPFMTGATALQSNVLAWLTPIAVILVMALGAMAMANRLSWGWCLGAILGIAIAFGAPQIVTWVRGMFGV
jgi:type IV secretion system protein VirB2